MTQRGVPDRRGPFMSRILSLVSLGLCLGLSFNSKELLGADSINGEATSMKYWSPTGKLGAGHQKTLVAEIQLPSNSLDIKFILKSASSLSENSRPGSGRFTTYTYEISGRERSVAWEQDPPPSHALSRQIFFIDTQSTEAKRLVALTLEKVQSLKISLVEDQALLSVKIQALNEAEKRLKAFAELIPGK